MHPSIIRPRETGSTKFPALLPVASLSRHVKPPRRRYRQRRISCQGEAIQVVSRNDTACSRKATGTAAQTHHDWAVSSGF